MQAYLRAGIEFTTFTFIKCNVCIYLFIIPIAIFKIAYVLFSFDSQSDYCAVRGSQATTKLVTRSKSFFNTAFIFRCLLCNAFLKPISTGSDESYIEMILYYNRRFPQLFFIGLLSFFKFQAISLAGQPERAECPTLRSPHTSCASSSFIYFKAYSGNLLQINSRP